MSSEPVYLRWEHTAPPHRKFYEVDVQLSLFYPKVLVRRWGRIGSRRSRSLRIVVGDPDELDRRVARIAARRRTHGYHVVNELHASAIRASAA